MSNLTPLGDDQKNSHLVAVKLELGAHFYTTLLRLLHEGCEWPAHRHTSEVTFRLELPYVYIVGVAVLMT